GAWPVTDGSKRALDLDALEALDLVADLHVVALHADASVHAVAHFLDGFLEPPQRLQFALEHHHAVAQHADRLVPLDEAFDDHATGDLAELRRAEDLADVGDADDVLADLGTEQSGNRLLHLVDHVVDDREIAYVQAEIADDTTRRRIGADV